VWQGVFLNFGAVASIFRKTMQVSYLVRYTPTPREAFLSVSEVQQLFERSDFDPLSLAASVCRNEKTLCLVVVLGVYFENI